MNILIVQIEVTEIKEINAQPMSGAESAECVRAPKSVASSANEHPETTAHPKSTDKKHADQHPENTILNEHAEQNASSNEPSTSKSMHEHFVEPPEDASSTNKSAIQYVVEQTAFSDELSISKPDHVVEQPETMRKRQIIVNTYELLNEQAAIIVALTDNESVQLQMGPINDYFMKFKQFVYALPDNSTFKIERLLRISKKIEERKEEVKFEEDKAMLEKIREGMNGLETELRDKIATIAEEIEVIGGVVQKVIEYQVGKYVQKEYNYLLTARKNLSLPLKIISEFFGKLELSEAYLKHVEKTIRQIYLSVWTSRRYYVKVESCLVVIGAMISNVSDEVAKNLQIEKVLGRNPVEHLFELQQVAQLEGMPLTEEQVVLLYMSKCLQRAQTLLEKAIKHLKSIENDFCLINSVGIVIKSADALAKLRRNILLMKNRQ
uniref:Uncharacterized protein n=1 Tax=Globodera rostochiensis TaxID=31243 RepID=A0A914H1R0_GLORO